MTLGRIGCALAVVAVLCVLTVFFFPAMQGPYSVVNGPATALLSARAAASILMAIVYAGLLVLGIRLRSSVATACWAAASIAGSRADRLATECSAVLRC